jgi:hypothetical protein
MNIIDVYSKYNKGLIILFSGLTGSQKTLIGKNIADNFNMEYINVDNYKKKDYNNLVNLDEHTTVIDWDNIDSYDWEAVNNDVNEKIKIFNDNDNENIKKLNNNGLVIISTFFIDDVIKFKYDLHIHIKISKKKFIEKREEYINLHNELKKNINTEYLIINKLTFPHYLEYLEKITVNKYVNTKDKSLSDIYNDVFDFLIDQIEKFIEKNKTDIDNYYKKIL